MDLDSVITELGQFGKYQAKIYFLLFFPFLHHSICSLSFVFTVLDLKYRCEIPECDGNITNNYAVPWLEAAIPHSSEHVIIDQCQRYKYLGPLTNSVNNCSQEGLFSFNETERCDKFIFETSENSVTNEFNLLCKENDWKRTSVGTLNNFAQLLGLPISGILSDRYGRKFATVIGVLISALFGTLRSFTTTYLQFVILEMLDAMASAGVYCSIFILGVEVIGPDMRGFSGVLLATYYPIGTVILGAVSWWVTDWRLILRILYIPGFLFAFYFWLLPESFRWLISNGRRKQAVHMIKKVAETNGKPISDGIHTFLQKVENTAIVVDAKEPSSPLSEVLVSRITLLRLLNCCYSWITHTFVFYGLSLNSVSIAGNKYLNFILVSLVEIPAYPIAWYMIDTLGRRLTIFLALLLTWVACTAFAFLSTDAYVLRLTLFMTGKFAISISFTAMYILASELFPTPLRNSLMGFCSTVGRIGSMLAPQTPLLAAYIEPVLVFGFSSFIAAFLGLLFPETLNHKLPDTLGEAELIGKKSAEENKRKRRYQKSDS